MAVAFLDFLPLMRAAQARGGEYWIGYRAGIIYRALWHISSAVRVPGWWGWFR